MSTLTQIPALRCVLNVGHGPNRLPGGAPIWDPGAYNRTLHLAEHDFNKKLLAKILELGEGGGLELIPVFQQSWKGLPDQINALNPDFIVSLHANAAGTNVKASGSQVLYWCSSPTGQAMADALQTQFEKLWGPTQRARRTVALELSDRGGGLLYFTHAPCVIAEPFFMDNDDELRRALDNMDELAMAYVRGLLQIARLPVFAKAA